MDPPRLWSRLLLGVTALFLGAPMVVVIAVSLNASHRMNFPPTALSPRWYEVFFTDPAWLASLRTSLSVAALASLTATAVALPLAYAGWFHGSRAAKWLAGMGSMLFLAPTVVSAMMFVIFWGVVRHVGRVENIVLSHAVVFLALSIAIISSGLKSIDRGLVEAANTMGADDIDTFRLVIRPSIMPHIICSILFVFVFSLNEYLIAAMVSGFTTPTLPIKIFNTMRAGYEPTMCVAAVVFMVIGFAIFCLLARLGDLPRLLGRDTPLDI
jgi:putative spermidine/putrescine transport system permease protein